MDSMAREHLDNLWAPFNEARVYPLTKEFTFAVSGRLFIGQHSGSLSPERRKIEMEYDHIGRNDGEANCQDLLGRLLMASDEDGKFIKEKDIAITIAGILLASSYTTNNTTTSLVSHLADHPHVYEKVYQEHLEIAKSKRTGERFIWADLQKMKYSWNTVCETLRLTAPGQGGGFREVIDDFKFESFNIPRGWKVRYIVCQTGAHLGSLIYNFLCCARH
ncbi:hypothetical protein Cgig2_007610 [Carnegiea gigantea]|uniref:Cytochrome P450 n=1 Tax=Carnegiea gigantea TaxID=171969 RepID=A0A9Q1Q6V6_9CARY|nr:hypothetical protein Cgig2_007610 [Carnegiea gigantea]